MKKKYIYLGFYIKKKLLQKLNAEQIKPEHEGAQEIIFKTEDYFLDSEFQ